MAALSNPAYPESDFHRDMARTPSPSPSEQAALDSDGKPHFKRIFKREHLSAFVRLASVRLRLTRQQSSCWPLP
jgi:hypothetical protein